ncbi:MAG: PilZ domain-containing protein [Proteobacteria bacterium]|nr:PilZ domain-containing protein [Pseudomonadota bacterium]
MPHTDIRKLIRESDKKNEMTASFLTDLEVRRAVEKTAREDNQSVSYVIESIIRSYFKDNKTLKSIDEKRRRFERKSTGFSCFIGNADSQARDLITATIMDISHGGVRVSIPKGSDLDIKSIFAETFIVIFTLPNCNWPIKLECRSQRVFDHEDEIHIGANIINPDCSVCLALQQCMV